MATLKIFNDIQTEDEKVYCFGAEGVCYKDVEDFCNNISDDDNEIDIRLFCNGGNVQEGWAIYDRLRQTNKNISCTVEGKAASMATIILMAAPKERRFAYENASICVHNPWIYSWALDGELTAEDLRKFASQLQSEQDKILDLYVERCGCDRAEMQALMDEDKFIDTDKAIELGLIAEVLPPMSANKNKIKSKKMGKKQNEDNVQVPKTFFEKVLSFFGAKSISEITFGMKLNTSDGQTLTISRDEGEPQVGDKASPDGTFKMPDDKTITIENGEITDIENPSDDSDGDDDGDGSSNDHATEQIEALTRERDALQARVEELEQNTYSTEDYQILNAVRMAGGVKALAKLQSNFTPSKRDSDSKKTDDIVNDKENTRNTIIEKLKLMNKK